MILQDAEYFLEDPSAPRSSISTVGAKKTLQGYTTEPNLALLIKVKKKKEDFFSQNSSFSLYVLTHQWLASPVPKEPHLKKDSLAPHYEGIQPGM